LPEISFDVKVGFVFKEFTLMSRAVSAASFNQAAKPPPELVAALARIAASPDAHDVLRAFGERDQRIYGEKMRELDYLASVRAHCQRIIAAQSAEKMEHDLRLLKEGLPATLPAPKTLKIAKLGQA
jgi:hypothetical protein